MIGCHFKDEINDTWKFVNRPGIPKLANTREVTSFSQVDILNLFTTVVVLLCYDCNIIRANGVVYINVLFTVGLRVNTFFLYLLCP